MIDVLEQIVGAPVSFEELKHKPGRRRTLRAGGSKGSAIVKTYASDRATVVARRIQALAGGPAEPVLPTVLHLDSELHLLVLTDAPGPPLREALLDANLEACARAGAALAVWHLAWQGVPPTPLRRHTIDREVEILLSHAQHASPRVSRAVIGALSPLPPEWVCSTVVHRDLYEEQVIVGAQVALIDVDDAAIGPPELDVGNLLAHVELLEHRRGQDLREACLAFLEGYADGGPPLDDALLERCRRLSLLRLACLNDDAALVEHALTHNVDERLSRSRTSVVPSEPS
jgi:Ser/Thr protein kinase RdoA (MazF antagonist)